MTTKTINCAECEKEYTYEPPKGYPDKRKYCAPCSAKNKASFEGKEEEPPIVHEKPGEQIKTTDKKTDNGFHLSPEQVRSNALASAIEWWEKQSPTNEMLMITVKQFEKYILTGE